MPALPLLFPGPEHQPFELKGGAPGALLVHGFPGTPAEVRPLGDALHTAGWTVRGLLLPGFGPQFDTLFERRASEWMGAVTGALADLQRAHEPVLLIGYSMGGALALHAARAAPPHGLVLLAPFWRLRASWLQRFIFGVVRRFVPHFQPFAHADFANPRLREGLGRMLPGLPLDDPAVQAQLRAVRVPAALLDELQLVIRGAMAAASDIRAPTLVVQGEHDETTLPVDTRQLFARLRAPAQLTLVPGGHACLEPGQPGWPALRQAVLDFAAIVQAQPRSHGKQ